LSLLPALSAFCHRPFDFLELCRPYVIVDLLSIDLSQVDLLPPHRKD
jgi:hypothetical protein